MTPAGGLGRRTELKANRVAEAWRPLLPQQRLVAAPAPGPPVGMRALPLVAM